jgi:eukaryotic-like serine/threonine-protein kinase
MKCNELFSFASSSTMTLLMIITPIHIVGSEQIQNIHFTTYENRHLGITIDYPSSWTRTEYDQVESSNIISFAPSEQISSMLPFFTIHVSNVTTDNKTITEYIYEQIQDLKRNYLDFKLIESKATILASYPAHLIVYTFQMPYLPEEYKTMEIWILNKNNLYVIGYATETSNYTKYTQVIKKMVNSFHLTNAYH